MPPVLFTDMTEVSALIATKPLALGSQSMEHHTFAGFARCPRKPMNLSTQIHDGAERHETAMADFVQAVNHLRQSASLVVKLGRQEFRNGIGELDDGSGDLERRILVLMDDIESSFRTIRRKLSS